MGLRVRARASWDVAVKFHYLLLSKSGLKSIKKQEAWGVGWGEAFFQWKIIAAHGGLCCISSL